MIGFLDVLEKEVWKKRFFAGLSVFLLFLLLLSILFRGERKTWKDKVYEYITCRMNFTYVDVERAYFKCPYTTKMFGYELMVKNEVEELKKSKVFSWFYTNKSLITRDDDGTIRVIGRRITGRYEGNEIKDVREYRALVKLGVKNGLYVISVEE
ncbi:MAG TPA: hypothetical protein EYH58_07680 [Aquifex aeolicus]|nr:hypothetical protein [Aquifex aeolicus]